MLHLVTTVAILLYGEGLFTLYVTGAARFPFLHLLLGDSLVFCRGEVEFDVAISAFIESCVKIVAEFDVSCVLQLDFYILGGMALHAVFDLKCFFAVMTGAAGFPLFHLGHGDDSSFWSHIVKFRMTEGAVVGIGAFEMRLVSEFYRSRFFYLEVYIRNFVTLDAVLEIESPLAVMAGAAGLAFFHICHGVTSLASEIEYGIMTCLAVILDALLFEVLIVAEYNLAEVGYLHGDIFYVDRISEGAYENRHGQDEKRVPLIHDCLLKNRKESPLQKRNFILLRMRFHILPTCPHLPEVGKRRMPQCRHVDVDAKEGKKRASDQVMGVHKELDPSDHDDPSSQRGDVQQKQAADDHQRQEQKHDEQVAHLLNGVELVVLRGDMGILFAQKVVKKVEKRLCEEPSFDIFHVGDIEFHQTSGHDKIVKYPEKKRDGHRHAGDVV